MKTERKMGNGDRGRGGTKTTMQTERKMGNLDCNGDREEDGESRLQ